MSGHGRAAGAPVALCLGPRAAGEWPRLGLPGERESCPVVRKGASGAEAASWS